MKKLLLTAVVAAFVTSLTVGAAEGAKKQLTPEQKEARKALLEKYDTNKDGKLDKDERAKMSPEDKAKLGQHGGKKKKQADGE